MSELMPEYVKIQSVYKRDPENNHKTFLEGEWSMPEFGYLANCRWSATEKVDGTNIRVHYEPQSDIIHFGGRTDNAQIPVFLLEKLQEHFNKEKFAEHFDCPVTLYGEGYGAKIQKGGGNYIPNGVDFILFDVLIGGMWLERVNVLDVGLKLNIGVVPEIENLTLYEAIQKCRSGFRSGWGDFEAEGLVLRPDVELQTRRGQRVITKVKCRDFR